jgi:hypothetical protein
LVTGCEIDNRQPAVAEPNTRCEMKAITIRSAMTEDIGHAAKQGSIDLGPPAIVKDTRYTAHLL